MNTLKITLAAIVIAASASSAFAIDTNGRGDRVTAADAAVSANDQVGVATFFNAPIAAQDNAPIIRDHVNQHSSR